MGYLCTVAIQGTAVCTWQANRALGASSSPAGSQAHADSPHLPGADRQDVADVGEEVVVLRLCHGLPQLFRPHEVAHQHAQAVHVGVLRRDDLKHGLKKQDGEDVTHKLTEPGRELKLAVSQLHSAGTKLLEVTLLQQHGVSCIISAWPGLPQ